MLVFQGTTEHSVHRLLFVMVLQVTMQLFAIDTEIAQLQRPALACLVTLELIVHIQSAIILQVTFQVFVMAMEIVQHQNHANAHLGIMGHIVHIPFAME